MITARRSWTSLVAITATSLGIVTAFSSAASAARPSPPGPSNVCKLANGISHVIELQFDNVHLTRDSPNVASDLEQMPNLFNFLKTQGVVLGNTHDVLVHTATNFIANQTGLYPDRNAITQSNSFNYYDSAGKTHPGNSFAYWTDPIYDPSGNKTDTKYNTQYTADRNSVPNDSNINTPAPWVPFTRAGCNVGEVGMSNTVLENIATDIPTVFGPNSPEQAEATSNPAKAQADFVGFSVHCAKTSATCANGKSDTLPDEPGGYSGYQALFGGAEIQPEISPSGPVKALDGSTIADSLGNPGFPGFDSETATNSLGYAAQLLEHGVQIANVYLSDVHGDHTASKLGDLGPGTKLYTQQLHDYDTAFGQFMTRLAHDGITGKNTLFAVTTDEGDHFSGSAPTPSNCTGTAGNYCNYAVSSEVNVNLPGVLATTKNNTTPFAIHSDPAPALWVTGNPARNDQTVRQLERDISSSTVANPLTGQTDKLAYQMADPVEEKILHFVSADAARTPSLTFYSGEDEYVGGGAANCTKPCVYTSQGFAWNHGGLWPDMQTIFSAFAGPGISSRGIDNRTFTDQVDTRPTLLALSGLQDSYPGDGRVLTEIASPKALAPALRSNRFQVRRLGQAYKQLLATTGDFALNTLAASTRALASGDASEDHTYAAIERVLATLDTLRNRLADQIRSQLEGAAFHGHPISARQANRLLGEANLLLRSTRVLAGH